MSGHEHDERCAGRDHAGMFRAFLADLLGRERAADAVERAIIDYGAELERAIDLNQRYAGRWHCWFVALAGRVEWLARPADAEPVGEPTITAWSAVELADRIDRIGRHM